MRAPPKGAGLASGEAGRDVAVVARFWRQPLPRVPDPSRSLARYPAQIPGNDSAGSAGVDAHYGKIGRPCFREKREAEFITALPRNFCLDDDFFYVVEKLDDL
jgi:hypothetical protein